MEARNLRNIFILSMALEIIETNLCISFSVDDLAQRSYCSSSGLQKLFRYAFNYSVADYIAKRRLSVASRDLLLSNKSVTDIALDYQYTSPEVFTRAFKRFWGITPSEFKKTRRFTELLPKFENPTEYGGDSMVKKNPIDISDLYDKLKNMSDTFILSVDMKNFMQVNTEHGFAIGDLAIAAAFHRIENELLEDMMLFRIGGDEFAVITGYYDVNETERLARRITNHNDETVKLNDKDIPIPLRIGICKIPHNSLSYHKALEIMTNSVEKTRKSNDCVSIYEM